MQGPSQGESQQTPSTHWPLWQAEDRGHGLPSPRSDTHEPPWQWASVAHCASVSQAPAHETPSLQTKGEQRLSCCLHLPAASQSDRLSVPLMQRVRPQGVSTGKREQAPLPSQAPVLPQVLASSAGHSSSGSASAPMGPHTPSAPPVLAPTHASHSPEQSRSQQTPSAQNSEAHSPSSPHASP